MARGEEVRGQVDMVLQGREKQKRLEQLRRDILRKIDFLGKKTVIEYHEFYHLVKEFFREFLERRYEFTINELRQELKKVYISHATRAAISRLLDELEASEYTTVHYQRQHLLRLLQEFRQIVEELVKVHVRGRSIFDRIKSFFVREPDVQTIIAELPVVEGHDAFHVRIYTLIERCYIALDKHNISKARATYEALLRDYEHLPEEEKAEYYDVIHQTYADIVHRAQMLRR
jgi:hypothetical protein